MNPNLPNPTITINLGVIRRGGLVHLFIPRDEMWVGIDHHQQGDWGNIDPDAKEWNRKTLERTEGTLFSKHKTSSGTFFIITHVKPDATKNHTEVNIPFGLI